MTTTEFVEAIYNNTVVYMKCSECKYHDYSCKWTISSIPVAGDGDEIYTRKVVECPNCGRRTNTYDECLTAIQITI